MNDETYVLEWSKKQGCFHVQQLRHTIKKNLRAFAENRTLNDYHIILVGTFDEVTDAADQLRGEFLSRRKEEQV